MIVPCGPGFPEASEDELWGFPVEAAGSNAFDFALLSQRADKNFLRKFLRPISVRKPPSPGVATASLIFGEGDKSSHSEKKGRFPNLLFFYLKML